MCKWRVAGLLLIAAPMAALCGQAPPRETEVVVVGTVHQPTPHFTASHLIEIFRRVRPDVILEEWDSSFFQNGVYTIQEKYRGKWETVETEAVATWQNATLERKGEFKGDVRAGLDEMHRLQRVRQTCAAQALARFEKAWLWWVDFEKRRHVEMVKNIVRYAGEFRGRRIVVLCGFEHRFYLRKELEQLQKQEKFRLIEYCSLTP